MLRLRTQPKDKFSDGLIIRWHCLEVVKLRTCDLLEEVVTGAMPCPGFSYVPYSVLQLS